MSRYVLSPRAQRDVADVWDYTLERWGMDQAERYLRRLQVHIETLAASPGVGRPCDDIRPGYRRYTSGSHVIFYRANDSGIEVVRILHARMDLLRQL